MPPKKILPGKHELDDLLKALDNPEDPNYIEVNEDDQFKFKRKRGRPFKPNKRDPRKSPNLTRHFLYFLDKFKLKKGTKPTEDLTVEGFMIYYVYDNWCYSNNRKKQLGQLNFFKMINSHLGPYTKGKQHTLLFLIDKEAKDTFTPELINKATEWSANRHRNNYYKQPETKLSKIRAILKFQRKMKRTQKSGK